MSSERNKHTILLVSKTCFDNNKEEEEFLFDYLQFSSFGYVAYVSFSLSIYAEYLFSYVSRKEMNAYMHSFVSD